MAMIARALTPEPPLSAMSPPSCERRSPPRTPVRDSSAAPHHEAKGKSRASPGRVVSTCSLASRSGRRESRVTPFPPVPDPNDSRIPTSKTRLRGGLTTSLFALLLTGIDRDLHAEVLLP